MDSPPAAYSCALPKHKDNSGTVEDSPQGPDRQLSTAGGYLKGSKKHQEGSLGREGDEEEPLTGGPPHG